MQINRILTELRRLKLRGPVTNYSSPCSWLAVWLCGNALVSINNVVALRQTRLVPHDRLWTGKPSRYVTSQLGRLSLLPSVGR